MPAEAPEGILDLMTGRNLHLLLIFSFSMMVKGTATSQQSFPVLPRQLIPELSLEDQFKLKMQ